MLDCLSVRTQFAHTKDGLAGFMAAVGGLMRCRGNFWVVMLMFEDLDESEFAELLPRTPNSDEQRVFLPCF